MKYKSSQSKRVYDVEFDPARKSMYKCPECSEGRKKASSKDLEFYPDTKRAYCFHCNTTLYEYKQFEASPVYTVPQWKNKTELTDKSVKYFEGRMISQNTLDEMKVHSDLEWMPQFQKEVEVICFPYFKNQQLVNIKFRGANKSFKLVSNAELVWYNFDCIAGTKEIIICEGEIDALTFVENGFKNVISVPNGAKSKSEYLDNSIMCLDHIERIYLATDVDTPGIELKEELIRRLGAERCYSVDFKDCKDANEYFCKYGGYDFKNVISAAKPIPISGNVEISSLYNEIVDLYQNGLEKGKAIGIEEIDQYCTWELGRLCTVTGIPSSGKSEFVDFLVARLNLFHGWKAAYFTPENFPLKYHYAKMHEKFSGNKFRKLNDQTEFQSIYEYVKDNFFYIMNEQDFTIESVMKSAKSFVKQKGIKILVIDPFNRLEHQMNKGENETQYISRFLDILGNFARFNNVLVFLVAHPRKVDQEKVPTMYDISGSANFYNKTDYGFSVHRLRDENNAMNNSVEVHWQKIKFKHLGTQGASSLDYNFYNGRFDPRGVFDNTDWLKTTPVVIDFWDNPVNTEQIPSNSNFYKK
ncbi:MAG TPA: DnaB-like helicase C-terminal domain-containing protein [Prolixibacteraceae bacterium]|jgi:twinkle protein